jgi:thiol-disulfide isomerase/thioredoxin
MLRSPQRAVLLPSGRGAFVAALLLAIVAIAPPAAAAAPSAVTARLDSLARAEWRVRWQKGPVDSALSRARVAGRPAFLDFYADWCVPCRWMDRAVYTDPLLAEVAEDVAMIRIDIETPEGRALAARFDVRLYPTLVFLAADGREALRWPGPLSLRDTRLNLSQMALPSSGRFAVEAARAAQPGDLGVQARAILWYGGRGEVERARAIADSAEAALGAAAPRGALAMLRLNRAKAEEMAGRTARARAAYESARDADPDGAFAWRAWLGISTTAEAARDGAVATAAAREALARNPQPWLAARAARLELAATAPALPTPPGVEDGDDGSR